jgi:transcriptional regulator with XRE-family HTH domain
MTEEEFYKKLGENCQKLREKAGISPTEMVKRTGVSRSLLYEFETRGKKISAFRLNKIMQVLGLPSIEEWFDPEKKKELNIIVSGSEIAKLMNGKHDKTLDKITETIRLLFLSSEICDEEVDRIQPDEENDPADNQKET